MNRPQGSLHFGLDRLLEPLLQRRLAQADPAKQLAQEWAIGGQIDREREQGFDTSRGNLTKNRLHL